MLGKEKRGDSSGGKGLSKEKKEWVFKRPLIPIVREKDLKEYFVNKDSRERTGISDCNLFVHLLSAIFKVQNNLFIVVVAMLLFLYLLKLEI